MKERVLFNENGLKQRLNFNLKQTREKEKLTQIMLVTTVNGQRIRIYTKLRVEPLYWDKQKHCCLQEAAVNQREQNRLKLINRQILQIKHNITRTDEQLARRGEYLSKSLIRRVVEENCCEDAHQGVTPLDYFKREVDKYDEQVNRKGQRGVGSTRITYQTALKRLQRFCKEQQVELSSFADFDKKFFTDFTNFLYNSTFERNRVRHHYTQNTIINTLKVIKNLLHRAYDNDLTDNNYFLKVQTSLPADVSEKIYLQESEIKRFASLSVQSKQEEEVRDMFVISCYTALRISDIQQLNKANITASTISLYQTKTKEQVEIPILKEIRPILDKYKESGFPRLSPKCANQHVRMLFMRCGLDEPVTYKENRGGVVHIKTAPKWQLISFHTARRSCITNLYKRGYPPNYIMTLSGHHSQQAFQRYMRASSKELLSSFVHMLKKNRAL